MPLGSLGAEGEDGSLNVGKSLLSLGLCDQFVAWILFGVTQCTLYPRNHRP